jgi:hypothetical protein
VRGKPTQAKAWARFSRPFGPIIRVQSVKAFRVDYAGLVCQGFSGRLCGSVLSRRFHGPSGRDLHLELPPPTAEPSASERRRIKPGHARHEQGTMSGDGGTLKKRLTLPEIFIVIRLSNPHGKAS